MMRANAVSNNRNGSGWRKWLLRSLGAISSILVLGGVAGRSIAVAQGENYRNAASAPAEWQTFARQLQSRFQDRLAADDQAAREFQEFMAKRKGKEATLTLEVRTWILPNGKFERLEFDGLDDSDIVLSLRALLIRDDVGVPPPDMLQPLRLRLSLRSKDQPGQHP